VPSDNKLNNEFEDFRTNLKNSLGLDNFNINFNNKHISLSLSLPGEQIDPFANDGDDEDVEYARFISENNSPIKGSKEIQRNSNSNGKTDLFISDNNQSVPYNQDQQSSPQKQHPLKNSYTDTDKVSENDEVIDDLLSAHPHPENVKEPINTDQKLNNNNNSNNLNEDSISSEANKFADLIDEVMTSGNK